MRNGIPGQVFSKAAPYFGLTTVFVAAIELCRLLGMLVPTPFLLLYAVIVLSGGAGGRVAGTASGALAAAYVMYAAKIGFGPPTLTGGAIQVLFGTVLYVGSGFLLGRVRDQRNKFLQDVSQFQRELRSKIESRTREVINKENALIENEARTQAILKNTAIGIVTIDDDGQIDSINPAACEIFGYSADELSGKNVSMLMPEPDRSLHDNYLESYLADGERKIIGNGQRIVEGKRKDGSVFPLGVSIGEVFFNGKHLFIGSLRDVTDRIEAEAKIRESEEHYRTLVEMSPDGIMVHFDGIVVLCNAKMASILGAEHSGEIIGRSAIEFVPPEERKAVMEQRSKALRGDLTAAEARESVCQRLDGARIYVERSIATISWEGRQGFLVLIRDITDRKKVEEELRSSEEKFRQMAENISEVFWMTSPAKDRVLYVSPAYEKVWERSRLTLYNNPLSIVDSIHPDDRTRARSIFQRQADHGYDEEYRIVRPNGEVRQIRDRAFPITGENGEVYRVVGIAEDITEIRRRDEQLRQSQKMTSLGTLAGGIAHELNNILLPIIGLTELLQEDLPTQSRAHKNLSAILRNAERASVIVEKILSFSHQDTAKLCAVDLRRVIEEDLELIRATVPSTIKLDVDVDVEANEDPVAVLADETQLHQILMNLTSNAIYAMKGNVGTLTLRLTSIKLRNGAECRRLGLEAGGYAKLSVQDTGHGMNKETTERIFEPFFTTKDVGDGTGLGLSITHGIIAAHHGAIDVASEPANGTTFDIYLPLADGVKPTSAAHRVKSIPALRRIAN